MRLSQLLAPSQVARSGTHSYSNCLLSPLLAQRLACLTIGEANAVVEGRRHATVRSQGAYKLRSNKTIPKKLGAKRLGDQYVIPGNIIYKQRGTIWHAGENAILGRDHTIHAAVAGYVKYYRDPSLHPTKQYIGVALERSDKLPYPKNAVRNRRLALVPTARRQLQATSDISPSGIPTRLVRAGDSVRFVSASDAKGAAKSGGTGDKEDRRAVPASSLALTRSREYYLHKDYSYRESNWQLGRLVGKVGKQIGSTKGWSRKAVFRSQRRKRRAELEGLKIMAQEQAKARAAAHEKEQAKQAAESVRAAKEQAKREARLAALEAKEVGELAIPPSNGAPRP